MTMMLTLAEPAMLNCWDESDARATEQKHGKEA